MFGLIGFMVATGWIVSLGVGVYSLVFKVENNRWPWEDA